MAGLETRNKHRDSLFVFADLQLGNEEVCHRVKVRNLSNTGMMGEGNLNLTPGLRLTAELRNVGKVSGNVAWVQDNRFGVAFDIEIDASLVRKSSGAGQSEPAPAASYDMARRYMSHPDASKLRKS